MTVMNVNVMWVSPGYTTSNIRNAALDQNGNPTGESFMDEASMMPAEEVATLILKAIENIHKNKAWKSSLIENAKRKNISELDEFIEAALWLYKEQQLKLRDE